MSENCKCEVREREEQRMTLGFLMWVTGEMVMSPRERGGGRCTVWLADNEVLVGHSGGDGAVNHISVTWRQRFRGQQGRGCGVRGDTGWRQSSEERTFASKGGEQKRWSLPP